MNRHILPILCFVVCWMPMLVAVEPLEPHQDEWQLITKAIREGKPKTGRDLLVGIEQTAIETKQWDEVARAIATRVLLENSDRSGDDPQRLIDLDSEQHKHRATQIVICRKSTHGTFVGLFLKFVINSRRCFLMMEG